ncbi:MAG: DUF4352 domain-containing protein [Chloroflexi bacterium]|nr:DUF4352 domain-containing protein [Chloroflexota bacterium]
MYRLPIFLLGTLLLLAACGPLLEEPKATALPPSATPEPQEQRVPLGTEVILNEFSLRIIEVVRPADDLIAATDDFNALPPEGEQYVLLRLSVECLNIETDCDLLWLDYHLEDDRGERYTARLLMFGFEEQGERVLTMDSDIRQGERVEGVIVFSVPRTVDELVFVYSDLVVIGEPSRVVFDLSRQ